MVFLAWGARAAALLFSATILAQGLESQPVPFTVWIDFKALAAPDAPHPAWPEWLEQLEIQSPRNKAGEIIKTTLRLRMRKSGAPSNDLAVRLFFEDREGASPVVTAWSETGKQAFQSVPLGRGLGLPTSENMTIPMSGVDYLEMEVRGDGSNIRGVFLHWVKSVQTTQSLDFAPLEAVDPFGAAAPAERVDNNAHLFSSLPNQLAMPKVQLMLDPRGERTGEFSLQSALLSAQRKAAEPVTLDFEAPQELSAQPWLPPLETAPAPISLPTSDSYLFGRVKALLDAGPVKLGRGGVPNVTFEFELEKKPQVAVITFEILNTDVALPPNVVTNGRPTGSAMVSLPDLADPGYAQTPSAEPWDMHFHYTGWLKCQKVIPRSALHEGTNRVTIEADDPLGGVAVRAVEMQLKYAPSDAEP